MQLSVDQDSSSRGDDASNVNMTSMFNPQVQVNHHMHTTVNPNMKHPVFPSLNNELVSDYSGLQSTSWQPNGPPNQFLTTKNSLFSKQSNSVVTQEDQLIQDMKTKESIVHVRKLL